MTDTPAPQNITSMSPTEATAALDKMMLDLRGTATTVDRPVNPNEARARLTQLNADKNWADKLMNGDAAARAEFKTLTEMVAGSTDPFAAENEVVNSLDDRHAMPKARYDHMVEGLREQGMTAESAQYLRDLDAGKSVARPTAGDAKAAQAALDRLSRDSEWAKKVLAGDVKANALRTRLGNVIAFAADDGRPVTPALATWVNNLG